MPYSSQIRVLQITDGVSTFLPLTVKLWNLSTTISSDNQAFDHEVERESIVTPGGTGTVSFALVLGPSFNVSATDQSDKISITVEDPALPGIAFRSGPFNTLPPGFPANQNGFIHLIQLQAVPFSPSAITSSLPAVPFTLPHPDGFPFVVLTVRALTATPIAGAITVVATGTATGAPLIGTVGFTYRVNVVVTPSRSLWNVNEVLTASTVSTPSITFTGGGGIAGFEAALLNVFAPGIALSAADSVAAAVQTSINAAALTAAATAGGCTLAGAPVLPVGVQLAAENVTITSAGVFVLPTLGAFGNILTAVCPVPPPPPGGGGGSLCVILALAASLAPGLDPGPFRTFRDDVLGRSAFGRHYTALYYKHSAEMADVILSRPQLAAVAASLAFKVENCLATKHRLTPRLMIEMGLLGTKIFRHASPALKTDLSKLPW